MSLTSKVRKLMSHGFPRVSGDEPSEGPAYLAQVGFSPRERG